MICYMNVDTFIDEIKKRDAKEVEVFNRVVVADGVELHTSYTTEELTAILKDNDIKIKRARV